MQTTYLMIFWGYLYFYSYSHSYSYYYYYYYYCSVYEQVLLK